MNKDTKTILITGASSGIGEATAIKFAQNGNNVILTGRRKEKLAALAEKLEKEFNIQVLILNFDVRQEAEVKEAIEKLQGNWKKIDVLVNNAGLAVGLNTIDNGLIDDWERMIDTNIKGLLYVSRYVLPIMSEQGFGHVINIGSIAGKEVYKNGNVYCATKHAVDAITKAMRIDMLEHNIKVTSINPGAVETEFSIVRFKGDKEKADNVYNGFLPLTGKDIAEAVYWVTTLPLHMNINDMLVMPTAQANATIINKKQ